MTIFGFPKFGMMRKILMLMLFVAPLALCAQTKKDPRTKTKEKETKEVVTKEKKEPFTQKAVGIMRTNENIYCEIVIGSAGLNGVASIKIVLGANYKQVIQDKMILAGLESAKAVRYNSVVDALNALNAVGFRLVTSYQLDARGAVETHLVMEGENSAPDMNIPEKGVGNTMSRDPGLSTKGKK